MITTGSNQLYDTFNGIFLLDITDHYPIFTIVTIYCPSKPIRFKFRDHSRQNIAILELEVERYVNNHVQIPQDASSNINNFCNNLFVIYSNCCPIKEKEISFARLRQPWISAAIMISLNRKHELFRQYKNGTFTFDHYNSFMNNFTTTLRLAKISYLQRKFTECSNNSRDTWKTLNCMIRCKKKGKDVTLNHNGSPISDPSAIAEVFNNYFSNIASNLDRDIPHSNISPLYFLGAPLENSFFCLPPLIVKKLLI